mgnify:CR=1 FL=1
MADVMKLKDIADTEVEFSPLIDGGYSAPEERNRLIKRMIDGSVRIIQPYKKHLYSIPLNNISAADYAQFLEWWQDLDSLSFYPDLINDGATVYAVKIVNTASPFNLMNGLGDKYEGVLSLREI